jgi:hypothetical protein
VLAVDGQHGQVEGPQCPGRDGPGGPQVLDDGGVVDERGDLVGQAVQLAAPELAQPVLHVALGQAEAGQLEVVGHLVAPALDGDVGLDERQAGDPAAVGQRGLDGHQRAVAVAQQVHGPVDAELVEQPGEVGHRLLDGVAVARALAAAVAPLVVEDDLHVLDQHRRQRQVEAGQVVDQHAVQHHHRLAPGLPQALVVEADVADRELRHRPRPPPGRRRRRWPARPR